MPPALRTSTLAPTKLPIFPLPAKDCMDLNQKAYGVSGSLLDALRASSAAITSEWAPPSSQYVMNESRSRTSFRVGRYGEFKDDAICVTMRL